MFEINVSSVKVKRKLIGLFSLILKLKTSAQINSLLRKALKMYNHFVHFNIIFPSPLSELRHFSVNSVCISGSVYFPYLFNEGMSKLATPTSKHIQINDR